MITVAKYTNAPNDFAVIISGAESLENFKALIQRGLNTWDRAPAELKAFGDELIEGSVLQDYQAQEHAKPRSE